MTPLETLQKDTLGWQRQLKFAGFYKGKLDGIVGPLTREATDQWLMSHEQIADKFGMVDARSEGYLVTLQPLAALPIRQLIIALRALADWKIICGHRNYAEQDKLYDQRPRVTRARGGQSMHNFGLAADVCLFIGGKDVWEPDSGSKSIYNPVAAICKKLGLVWGGSFQSIYDPGHVQLGELAVSQLDRAYTQGTYTLHELMR